MKIESVKICEISSHEKNPKRHPDNQIKLIEKSIKRFGWTNPVILSADGVILAGHARVKAAIDAGLTEVPVIKTDLSGKEADAYLIADNRLSDIAPWDRDILGEVLNDLPDDLKELTGFDTMQQIKIISGDFMTDSYKYEQSAQNASINTDEDDTRIPEPPEKIGYKITGHFKTIDDLNDFAVLVGREFKSNEKTVIFPFDDINED